MSKEPFQTPQVGDCYTIMWAGDYVVERVDIEAQKAYWRTPDNKLDSIQFWLISAGINDGQISKRKGDRHD